MAVYGSCLCGAVRYEVTGILRDVVACHCRECRKSSGHFLAATATHPDNLIMLESRGLKWFCASEQAKRGFCDQCGSTLFWKPNFADRISIFAGSIDGDSQLNLTGHIFTAEKGDYYSIDHTEAAIYPMCGDNLDLPES